MAKFNYREMARAVASSDAGAKRVNTVMQRRFEEAKLGMLSDFDQHPVTKEIKGGVGAQNQSETLNNEGDLFSFIGFPENADPTSEVRNVLETKTYMASSKKGTPSGVKVQYKFSLRVPSEEIRTATPLPFEQGKSWVEGVEKGISGFGNYLRGRFRSPQPSRSGGGKQVAETVRQTTFKPRKYLSEIFTAFVEKFRR